METGPLMPRAGHSQCFLEGLPPLDTLRIMGSTLIGSSASWLLLGFLAAQTHTYYMRSAKDPPVFKMLVYTAVFLSGFGETAIESYVTYGYLISGWGSPRTAVNDLVPLFIQPEADVQPVFCAVTAYFVQLFFNWRIWKFSQAIWKAKRFAAALCLLIALTSTFSFALSIYLFAYQMTGTDELHQEIIIMLWSITTALVDVAITVCMMVILYHAKSSAYYGETRDKISGMLRLTIQTGFLTSILAIPIAPIEAFKIDGWNIFTCYLLGKSYVITLLVNLNARASHQPEPTMGDDASHISTMVFTPGQDLVTNGRSTTFSNRVASFIRTTTRSAHHALTASRVEDMEARFGIDEAAGARSSNGGHGE